MITTEQECTNKGKKIGYIGLVCIVIFVLLWIRATSGVPFLTTTTPTSMIHQERNEVFICDIRTDGWTKFETLGKTYSTASVKSNGVTLKYQVGINNHVKSIVLPSEIGNIVDFGDPKEIKVLYIKLMEGQGVEKSTVILQRRME